MPHREGPPDLGSPVRDLSHVEHEAHEPLALGRLVVHEKLGTLGIEHSIVEDVIFVVVVTPIVWERLEAVGNPFLRLPELVR